MILNDISSFGYTGYRREETKGSYHGGARIYQAGTGTFTAKDDNRYINPLNPRTLNLYQYCQGNPMAYTDPTGHEALMEGSQIAGLILYCPESLEKTYLERTLECLLLNNFSQEVTGAGIGIKVGLGVAGLDLPFDIVNIIADLCQYDDSKYKTRQEWWGNFALDVLAFAPLIGLAKYAKYLTDAKAVFKPVMKKAGEIGEIIRSTGRKISGVDDVGEELAKYGDDFGKIGTYVENPKIKVDWSKYADHGMERMKERGLNQELIDNIVENGEVLSQNGGSKFAYITKEGTVIVSKDGKLITTWSSANYDEAMLEIIKLLFGD